MAEQLLSRDAWELCALEVATQTVARHESTATSQIVCLMIAGSLWPEAKSLIVASALLDRSTSVEEAVRWAQLEENFQIERTGPSRRHLSYLPFKIMFLNCCQRVA